MYKWFERYFAFSRSELSGICVLGGLLFVIWLVTRLVSWGVNPDAADMAGHIEVIERFLAAAKEGEKKIAKVDSEPTRQKRSSEQVALSLAAVQGL